VTTLAGDPTCWVATDGTGGEACFSFPAGITTDGSNLYVADAGSNLIRKIVIATGEVTTVAGSEAGPGWEDGTGNAARFNFPQGITTDGTSLYVSDTGNGTIRKIK